MKTTIITTQKELKEIQKSGALTVLRFKGNAKDVFIVKGEKILAVTFYKTIGFVDGFRYEHATQKEAIQKMIEIINQ